MTSDMFQAITKKQTNTPFVPDPAVRYDHQSTAKTVFKRNNVPKQMYFYQPASDEEAEKINRFAGQKRIEREKDIAHGEKSFQEKNNVVQASKKQKPKKE
ncbi:MAG: hypothetical protein C0469_09085 [Cyanobacteria bacterium DS2.3.42]|nr:hypothetical protein [Cyanobacteria bacterium DS2.3.42]